MSQKLRWPSSANHNSKKKNTTTLTSTGSCVLWVVVVVFVICCCVFLFVVFVSCCHSYLLYFIFVVFSDFLFFCEILFTLEFSYFCIFLFAWFLFLIDCCASSLVNSIFNLWFSFSCLSVIFCEYMLLCRVILSSYLLCFPFLLLCFIHRCVGFCICVFFLFVVICCRVFSSFNLISNLCSLFVTVFLHLLCFLVSYSSLWLYLHICRCDLHFQSHRTNPTLKSDLSSISCFYIIFHVCIHYHTIQSYHLWFIHQ